MFYHRALQEKDVKAQGERMIFNLSAFHLFSTTCAKVHDFFDEIIYKNGSLSPLEKINGSGIYSKRN